MRKTRSPTENAKRLEAARLEQSTAASRKRECGWMGQSASSSSVHFASKPCWPPLSLRQRNYRRPHEAHQATISEIARISRPRPADFVGRTIGSGFHNHKSTADRIRLQFIRRIRKGTSNSRPDFSAESRFLDYTPCRVNLEIAGQRRLRCRSTDGPAEGSHSKGM